MKIILHTLDGEIEVKERVLDIEFVLSNGKSLMVDFRLGGFAIGARSVGQNGLSIRPVAGNLVNIFSTRYSDTTGGDRGAA